uniref:Uncharacterized protein n=1 Tax=Anopheles culicifacies TaxID=139723 RepID=A0A182LV34_9DIPT
MMMIADNSQTSQQTARPHTHDVDELICSFLYLTARWRGMLGYTANGRLMGPGVGSSTSSSSSSSLASSLQQQQQSHTAPHQQLSHHPYSALPSHHHHPLQPQQHPALAAHHHRSIWPSLGAATGRSAFELQTATNGEEVRFVCIIGIISVENCIPYRTVTNTDAVNDDDDDEDLTTSSMENHNSLCTTLAYGYTVFEQTAIFSFQDAFNDDDDDEDLTTSSMENHNSLCTTLAYGYTVFEQTAIFSFQVPGSDRHSGNWVLHTDSVVDRIQSNRVLLSNGPTTGWSFFCFAYFFSLGPQ